MKPVHQAWFAIQAGFGNAAHMLMLPTHLYVSHQSTLISPNMPRPNSRFTVTRDFDAAPVAGPAMSQDVWDGIEPAGPEPSSHLAEVLNLMHSARPLLDVSDLEMEVLSHARRETTAQLIVQRDNGDHTVFVGHRVQWNDARGPFKGGIRFHPSETLDMTRALAALMMLKTAVLDLPLGGGKGGVQCNPAALSRPERERLSRSYIRAMHPVLGPTLDIPAPDMNTDAEIMGWMVDEYESISGSHAPGVITGKPPALGGSRGRPEATALGGLVALDRIANNIGKPLAGSSLVIHGYGNVGGYAHHLAADITGARVTGVCDSRSGLYNPDGLPYAEVAAWKQEHGTFTGSPAGAAISPDELLAQPATALLLASMEGMIDSHNADDVEAEMVVELANQPITAAGGRQLLDRGLLVIPDILCNAGGVTVSYYEQVQNASWQRWSRTQVVERLQQEMASATDAVVDMADQHDTDLRTAAIALAMERVIEAQRARGWSATPPM